MRRVLGPLPCRTCRALVVLVDNGGALFLASKGTGRLHECEPLPKDWTWQMLVFRYGEDEALVQLVRLRNYDRSAERRRAKWREQQRRHRASTDTGTLSTGTAAA